MSAHPLAGRVAWITGAGSGIGRASAIAIARAGGRVILSGRQLQPLHETERTIVAAGGDAIVEPVDVGVPAACRAIVDRIVARSHRLDLFVGAAGYNLPERRWSDLSGERANAIIATNLSGAFNAASAALAPMRRQGDGLLIHISSWSGKHVRTLSGPAYTAAKAGLIALSESLNLEVAGEGIRSTVLVPGGVDTPLLKNLPTMVPEEVRRQLLTAEDCADLIMHVASLPPRIRIDELVVTPTMQVA